MKKFSVIKRFNKRPIGSMRTLGLFYGYPECCIEAFLTFSHLYSGTEGRPFIGTGFIPCAKCSKEKTEEQLLAEIAKNRIYREAFPEDGDNFNDEAAWLIACANDRSKDPRLNEKDYARIEKDIQDLRDANKHCKKTRAERQLNLSKLPAWALEALMKCRKNGWFTGPWVVFSVNNEYWKRLNPREYVASIRRGGRRHVLGTHYYSLLVRFESEKLGGEFRLETSYNQEPTPYRTEEEMGIFDIEAVPLEISFAPTDITKRVSESVREMAKQMLAESNFPSGGLGSIGFVHQPVTFEQAAEVFEKNEAALNSMVELMMNNPVPWLPTFMPTPIWASKLFVEEKNIAQLPVGGVQFTFKDDSETGDQNAH